MSRIGALVLGVLIGGGLVYGSLNYHVLRTETGYEFIPKSSATFSETYLDVRQFGVSQWAEHDEVARAVLKADKGHLMQGSLRQTLRQGVESVLDDFRQ